MMKRELPGEGWLVRILEHEKGVKFTALGGTSILDPGEHIRLPGWTRVVAVDMRERSVSGTYEVITRDFSRFEVTVDLRYKASFPDLVATSAPENLEERLAELVGAETKRYCQSSMTHQELNKKRVETAYAVRRTMETTTLDWGIHPVSVVIKDVKYLTAPAGAPPLVEIDYEKAVSLARAKWEQELAKINAATNAETSVIQAAASAEAYRRTMQARVDIFKQGIEVFGALAKTIQEQYGQDHGKQVLYAFLSSIRGGSEFGDLVGYNMRSIMLNDQARQTAAGLDTSPIFGEAVNRVRDICTGLIGAAAGGNPGESLKELDKRINEQYLRNPKKL